MLEEISLKGRGGQGVVTAGELLVATAIKQGYYAQSIPFYGGERRGAPVTSDVRVSNEPILLHSHVYNPDIVAVFDSSLLHIMNVTENLKPEGVVIVNSKQPIKVGPHTYVVDATDIAKELGLVIAGWPVVNTAMAGAIANVTRTIGLDDLEETIKENFEGKLGELNAEAAYRGFKEVRRID